MPFDLEKGPLLKLIIIQLAKRQYVFATIAHHIITDGWSNSMMFHELVSIAKVLSEEDALSLPDPEFQYLDYVAWEKKFLLNEANYINLPGLTSEKFIIKDGKRLYKTGDLVRCRGDGTIEFIGRRDRQLKVFGHRVELDEIEATLASHSGVKKAAVTIVDKVMVGYISLCNRLLTCEELKEFLRKKLPTYMIPTKIVFFGRATIN